MALLPCPFCGGSASFEEVDGVIQGSAWTVGCSDGGGSECIGFQPMTTFSRKSEAAKAWNTRALMPGAAPIIPGGLTVQSMAQNLRVYYGDPDSFTEAEDAISYALTGLHAGPERDAALAALALADRALSSSDHGGRPDAEAGGGR